MDTIALARGVPGPDLLPVDALRAAADRALSGSPTAALSYAGPGGYPPLRELLASWHGVDPARVLVTNGSLQGFALVVRTLELMGGLEVVVERPSYDRPLDLLRRTGIATHPVDLDAGGARIDDLPTAPTGDAGELMAYLIPNFHNPAGVVLDEERRARAAEWVMSPGRWIFEDDPYGRLGFDGPPPPSIHELAEGMRTIYASSLSKTVCPGIRIGYVVLPEELVEEASSLAASTYICPTTLSAAIAHEFLASDGFEPWIDTTRAALAERCSAMVDALATALPDASFVRPTGGYFLWLRLPDGVTAAEVARHAQGVTFVAGSDFGPGLDGFLRLAFSAHAPGEIEAGIGRLAAAVHAATGTLVQ